MELQAVLEPVNNDEILFHITIPASDTNTLIDQFTIALAYQNNIAPQEGEVLDDAVCARLGTEAVRASLEASIMDYSFPFAVEANQVTLVGKPTFTAQGNLERSHDFSFDAQGTLKPSVTLSSYGPVEITVPALEVTDQDVEAHLDALAKSRAYQIEDTSHSRIELGDQVELEIETYRDGVRCDQLCSESRTYTTGAQLMPETFDAEILQMSVGETKTIEYDCPGFTLNENYEPDTEHYTSTVTAKKVEKTIVPELNDAWIQENMNECNSLEELRAQVYETIKDRKTIEYRHFKNLQSAIVLAQRVEGTISPVVYDAVTSDIVRSFEEQLEQQQTTREEFLRQQGITEQQLMNHLTGQVREQLIRQLALDAVAEHAGLEVQDADLDEYFRAAASPGLEAMIRLDFERNGRMPEARLSALRLKANDYVTERAVIHINKS